MEQKRQDVTVDGFIVMVIRQVLIKPPVGHSDLASINTVHGSGEERSLQEARINDLRFSC